MKIKVEPRAPISKKDIYNMLAEQLHQIEEVEEIALITEGKGSDPQLLANVNWRTQAVFKKRAPQLLGLVYDKAISGTPYGSVHLGLDMFYVAPHGYTRHNLPAGENIAYLGVNLPFSDDYIVQPVVREMRGIRNIGNIAQFFAGSHNVLAMLAADSYEQLGRVQNQVTKMVGLGGMTRLYVVGNDRGSYWSRK